MYFWFTVVLVASAAKQTFCDSPSPFAKQPQHYIVSQSENKFPADLKLPYPVQQSFNEIDSNKQSQAKANGAVYDPDGYASSDPIQQYAGSYGPENNVESPAASGIVPVYGGLGNFGPYAYNNPGAFAVQSGYEGYLVPGPASNSPAAIDYADSAYSPFTALTNIIPSPRTVISAIGRALAVVLGLVGITVMGGGLTTAICTFTPLCTISFALPFVRSTAKKVAEAVDIDPETTERLSRAANFVQTALEKFQKMQAKSETPTFEAAPNKTDE